MHPLVMLAAYAMITKAGEYPSQNQMALEFVLVSGYPHSMSEKRVYLEKAKMKKRYLRTLVDGNVSGIVVVSWMAGKHLSVEIRQVLNCRQLRYRPNPKDHVLMQMVWVVRVLG